MSLNGAIISLGTIDLQVTRTALGARVNGRYTAGTQSTFTVTCGTPEPITGRELKDLPEGRRGDEVMKLFIDVPLYTESPTTAPDVLAYVGTDPDMIAMMGAAEPWTVIKVSTVPGFGEAHREVQIARAPSPQGAVP